MTRSLLTHVELLRQRVEDWSEFPFSVPCIRGLSDLTVTQPVCFFAGENGTGKSTLLEAIADNFGFGAQGGSKHTSVSEALVGVGWYCLSLRQDACTLSINVGVTPAHGYPIHP